MDWFYEMSDDHSVWRRGSAAMGEVQALYKDRPELKDLFDKYKEYMWSDWKRKPDDTPDYEAGKVVPKPERPKENVMRTGEGK